MWKKKDNRQALHPRGRQMSGCFEVRMANAAMFSTRLAAMAANFALAKLAALVAPAGAAERGQNKVPRHDSLGASGSSQIDAKVDRPGEFQSCFIGPSGMNPVANHAFSNFPSQTVSQHTDALYEPVSVGCQQCPR